MTFHLHIIEKYGERVTVKKRAMITEIGKREKYIYYIQAGLVRMYTECGAARHECTFDFVGEGEYANAFESYKFGTPSQIGIQAVTDCVLFRFSKTAVANALASGTIETGHYLDVMENTFLRKLKREISLLSDSSYSQYKKLTENNIKLFRSVPLKQIASYIGVSPQTISRYRKKEHEENG